MSTTQWGLFVHLGPSAQVARVMNAMAEVVSEHGTDYEYRGACQYVTMKDNAPVPDCIVGHVLARLGLPLADMYSDGSTCRMNQVAIDSPEATFARDLHKVTRTVLRAAQRVQDGDLTTSRPTWGNAYVAAEAVEASLWTMGVLVSEHDD